MKTHIFIVNDFTFPIHLKYLFAGTGASYRKEPIKEPIWVDWHIELLADIKRVRSGDLVIFYIEGSRETNGFYGIFKVKNQNPLVHHLPFDDGFKPENLQNKLIYRTLIEPYEVYSDGVPEWEALDKLPIYSIEVLWSLIYRKLKGKRGCTPLLPWEAQRLIDMIRDRNSGRFIANSQFQGGFDWDAEKRIVVTTQSTEIYPMPTNYDFNPVDAICYIQENKKSYEYYLKTTKHFEVLPQYLRRSRSYENYLQLYFVENIGLDHKLNPIVGNNVVWFGNEVSAGVGMQKIDILTICQNEGRKEFRIIELKDEPVKPDIVEQIEYYVNWASQNSGKHLQEAYSWNIQPVIVAPPLNRRNRKDIFDEFRRYNQKKISLPILYFEFKIDCEAKNIIFDQIDY
jgi:hypothetical protein